MGCLKNIHGLGHGGCRRHGREKGGGEVYGVDVGKVPLEDRESGTTGSRRWRAEAEGWSLALR